MVAHPPDLCPLCKQRALALNAAGTVLACTACGARADFDGATRRVRYTHVPQAYAQFDVALRHRWLTRIEVFAAVAVAPPPRSKRKWPWAVGLAVLGGVGLIGLAMALVRGLPAQPQARVVGTLTTPTAPIIEKRSANAVPTLANTLVASATAIRPPAQATALPTVIPSAPQPPQDATAAPVATPTLIAAATLLPTSTMPPQPSKQVALPTVDAQRTASMTTSQPSIDVPATTATPSAPVVPTSAAVAAQTPVPVGSAKATSVATVTPEPTQQPTDVVPTEIALLTATPIPTPTPTQTPVPVTFVISNIAYVGGSAFEEYLELTNATDQVMELPIQTWKLRINTAVGATELTLGAYITAPMSMSARQSCRIYTSKRAASAGEASPCGFLTLGIVDDVDGIYPDKPGATITLVNGESQIVALFRY